VVGYIPVDAMIEIAKYTKKYEVDVYGVATFYNQFRLKPPGKHQIKVCMGTACHIKNSERILDIWKRKLEIEEGEVTEDGKFGLERVACVGCCALAPVNVIDNEVYGKVTPTTVDGILLKLKSK
jgi:NADH-quinone oxidoreductase subunit E